MAARKSPKKTPDPVIRDASALPVAPASAYGGNVAGTAGYCLLCGNESARYLLTKNKGKLMMSCRQCNTVIYVNSIAGDRILRAWQHLLQDTNTRGQIMTLVLLANQQLQAAAAAGTGASAIPGALIAESGTHGVRISIPEAFPPALTRTP
jgi:hypothetical protein